MNAIKYGFFKKHVEMFTIIGVIVAVAALQEVRFSRIDDRMCALEKDMSEINKDLAQVKTVLIIRGMMPESMATGK